MTESEKQVLLVNELGLRSSLSLFCYIHDHQASAAFFHHPQPSLAHFVSLSGSKKGRRFKIESGCPVHRVFSLPCLVTLSLTATLTSFPGRGSLYRSLTDRGRSNCPLLQTDSHIKDSKKSCLPEGEHVMDMIRFMFFDHNLTLSDFFIVVNYCMGKCMRLFIAALYN